MKALKILAVLLLVYAAIVAGFEAMLGYFQPEGSGTLVLTTTDDGGDPHDRVLSRLDSDGQLFVAVNHWPRAWYRRALSNPSVEVNGEPHTAAPATEEEAARLRAQYPHGIVFKFLTGFPPRYFVRLDPAEAP